MATIKFIYILLLAIWLGSMVFFSFVVAPSAFALLPTRELAGSLVNLSLTKLHSLSYIIVLLMIACGVWISKGQSKPIRHFLTTNILIIVMFLVTLCSALIVTKRMEDVRAKIGPIDNVAVNHPLRLQFNRLHEVSVWLMSSNLLFSVVQLFIVLKLLY